MNQTPDDPNNHVPPIAPGDHWEDLDGNTESKPAGLPPRRVERVLPPKKESRKGKASDKPRMTVLEPEVEDSGDGEQAPANPAKTSRRARNNVRRTKVKKGDAVPEPSGPEAEESQEAAVVLPHPKAGKSGRVIEIKPGAGKSAPRPAAIVARDPSVAPDAEAKDAVRKRRRFLRTEFPDWGTKEGRGSMKWMLLAGLGVSCLVVLAVVMSQRPQAGKMQNRGQSLYSGLAPEEDGFIPNAQNGLDRLLNSRPETEAIFAKYASAESPDDFIGFVHAPARNRKLIESKWKPLGMDAGWLPGRDSTWYVKDGNGSRFVVFEGVLKDYTAFRAFFRQDDEGVLKMDWKATSGYGSADFEDLKSGKGDGSELRVWLSPADFYTFSFPEGEYRSFRIMSPKKDATIWGYVPAGGELEKELLELFLPSQITGHSEKEIQAILSIGVSEGDSLPEQWLIKDIVRTDWLDE